jgi:hypothetical protein
MNILKSSSGVATQYLVGTSTPLHSLFECFVFASHLHDKARSNE